MVRAGRTAALTLVAAVHVAFWLLVGAGISEAAKADHDMTTLTRFSLPRGFRNPTGTVDLRIGSAASVLARMRMAGTGEITGTGRFDRSILVLAGKVRSGKIKLKGKSLIQGRTDATLSFRGTIVGGAITGIGTLKRRSDGTLLRREAATGDLHSLSSELLQVHLDLQASGSSILGRCAVESDDGGSALLRLFEVLGRARGGAGADRVSFKGKGEGIGLKFKGTHDGETFTGTVSGKIGPHKLKRVPVEFPTGVPPSPYAFETGSGSAEVTIPPDGRLVDLLRIVTDEGVEFRVDPGTILRTPTGQIVTGDVRIDVHDGGRPESFPGPYIHDGTVGVSVSATGVPGEDVALPTWFDPPARVDIAIAEPLIDGGAWTSWHEPDFSNSNVDYVDVEINAGIERVCRSGTYGISHVEGAPGGGDAGDRIYEVQIPGNDTDEFPCVERLAISGLETGQILAVGHRAELGDGWHTTTGTGDEDPDYEFELVGRDGKRYVRVRTHGLNAVRVKTWTCEADGSSKELQGVPDENPPGEDDPDGPYHGRIDLEFDGWGDARVESDFYDRLVRAFPAEDLPNILPLFRVPGPDGAVHRSFQVLGFEKSVKKIAEYLGDGYEYEFGHRRITVTEKRPPPTTVVADLTNDKLVVVDPETLEKLLEVLLGGRPWNAVVSASGRRAYVSRPGALTCVNLDLGVVVDTVKVPGIESGIAVNHTGNVVYAVTDRGEFVAFDALTLERLWSVDGFPKENLQSISVSVDGSFAYFTAPDSNQVLGVDLLRRARLPVFTLPGAYEVEVSHDRRLLAVTDLNTNAVHFVDRVTGVPTATVPTGATPLQARFTSDDAYLVVPIFNGNALGIIDTKSHTYGKVPDIAGANGVDVYTTVDGTHMALTGGFNDNKLKLVLVTTAVVVVELLLKFQPGVIGFSGR